MNHPHVKETPYHVAIKAGLYRKAVQACYIPNTTTHLYMYRISAKPLFTFPLRNINADVGSSLTWRCEAQAVPKATFAWYKNSKLLTHVPGQFEIHENVLFIKSLDQARDEGMYQCAASNTHGTSITSAELRVLCMYVFTSSAFNS